MPGFRSSLASSCDLLYGIDDAFSPYPSMCMGVLKACGEEEAEGAMADGTNE